MSKSIYERVLSLRDRISLDGDDMIYEEDHLLLDEVLDYIGSNEHIDLIEEEQRAQEEIYNDTNDIYKELEIGVKFKKQEKLLELKNKLLYEYDEMFLKALGDRFYLLDSKQYIEDCKRTHKIHNEIKELEGELK